MGATCSCLGVLDTHLFPIIYALAKRCLYSVLKRLGDDPDKLENYTEAMRDQLAIGFIEVNSLTTIHKSITPLRWP